MKKELNINKDDYYKIQNSAFSSIYIPEQYKNEDELYLTNPLNISRYIINNYVGKNYNYKKD